MPTGDRPSPRSNAVTNLAQQLSWIHGCHRSGGGRLRGPCDGCRRRAAEVHDETAPKTPTPA